MRVLFVGDIFASVGRDYIKENLNSIKERYNIDFCFANAENATHGRGVSMDNADVLLMSGVNYITLGNHTWDVADIYTYISDYPMVRPANFAYGLPGKGWDIIQTEQGSIGIISMQGRVFMEPCANPFECVTKTIKEMNKAADKDNIILKTVFVDFHAETTSEKQAFLYYVDGQVTAVLGTHTHVQTADEHVTDSGTAFISDIGMTGPSDGIIGMDRKNVLEKFIKSVPKRFEPARGRAVFCAVVIDVDIDTGKAKSIERIQIRD